MKDDAVNNNLKEFNMSCSNLETIDFALFNWLNEKMDIFCTTNDGWKKVPIIWASAERSFMAKRSKEMRTLKGILNFPLISIQRTSSEKNLASKGSAWANIPPVNDEKGGSITIARRIQQEKTSNFANADSKRKHGQINFPRKNEKVVYETISIPMPVYIDVFYTIAVKTVYQQQMNEINQCFIDVGKGINYFIIDHDGHSFESFMQPTFKQNDNVTNMLEGERLFETEITIKILGHLIGKDKNDKQPRIVIRENAVEVRFPRERVIMGDEAPWKSDSGYVGIGSISSGQGNKK